MHANGHVNGHANGHVNGKGLGTGLGRGRVSHVGRKVDNRTVTVGNRMVTIPVLSHDLLTRQQLGF